MHRIITATCDHNFTNYLTTQYAICLKLTIKIKKLTMWTNTLINSVISNRCKEFTISCRISIFLVVYNKRHFFILNNSWLHLIYRKQRHWLDLTDTFLILWTTLRQSDSQCSVNYTDDESDITKRLILRARHTLTKYNSPMLEAAALTEDLPSVEWSFSTFMSKSQAHKTITTYLSINQSEIFEVA